MKEISPTSLKNNTFKMIGEDWMLITASNGNKVNTMTASWGGLGVFCGKNVAYTFIRPQRYTKEFVDNSETFSLSFLTEKYRKELSYLGKVSGKHEDKIENSGLSIAYDGITPYFTEAETIIFCKKICSIDIEETDFLQKELCEKWFTNNDYHTLYISEITKIIAE